MNLVTMANSKVPMPVTCRELGISVPPGTAPKVYCPFGAFYHPDHGHEAAMRVYRDHSWCFAEQEYFSPVKLASRVWGSEQEDAAVRLLDVIGYKPASYAQLWQAAAREPIVDTDAVSQALLNYCARLPGWEYLQLEPGVSEYLSRCLQFLTSVMTEDDARDWLHRSKLVMSAVVRRKRGGSV